MFRFLMVMIMILILNYDFSYGNLMIYLRNEAICGQEVRMKDIARFAGAYPSSEFENLSLKHLIIKKKISKDDLIVFLKKSYPEINMKIFGSENVSINQSKFVLRSSFLEEKVKEWIRNEMLNYYDSVRLTVRGGLKDFFLDVKPDSFFIECDNNFDKNLINPVIHAFNGERKLLEKRIGVYVVRYILSYSPVKQIERGEKIHLSDFERKLFPANFHGDGLLVDLKMIEGAIAKKRLLPGTLVKNRYFYYPFCVYRNSLILTEYSENGFTLEVRLKALESGKIGDMIKAENIKSGKIINVKIIGENRGEIIL